MKRQSLFTPQAPKPGGSYSQGLRIGDIVLTSGQRPVEPGTGRIAGDTIEQQTERTLQNIQAILEAGGASMADVVQTHVFLSDMSLFPKFNAVYERFFSDPRPVRTTVGADLGGVLVEIDAMAIITDDGSQP